MLCEASTASVPNQLRLHWCTWDLVPNHFRTAFTLVSHITGQHGFHSLSPKPTAASLLHLGPRPKPNHFRTAFTLVSLITGQHGFHSLSPKPTAASLLHLGPRPKPNHFRTAFTLVSLITGQHSFHSLSSKPTAASMVHMGPRSKPLQDSFHISMAFTSAWLPQRHKSVYSAAYFAAAATYSPF